MLPLSICWGVTSSRACSPISRSCNRILSRFLALSFLESVAPVASVLIHRSCNRGANDQRAQDTAAARFVEAKDSGSWT